MALTTEFKPLPLDELRREAAGLKADGWRFMQTHAVNGESAVDLYYSFMKDGHVLNLRIEGVTKEQQVPSITDLFLAAFVFENEARELFGVDMRNIAIDFHGAMYAPAQSEPMTFISPEQKAAREKALKVAAAKAAKAATHAESASLDTGGRRLFVMTPELQARLDAKYPTLSDDKKAKVDAALKARAEEAAGAEKTGQGAPGESACSAKTEGQAPKQVAVAPQVIEDAALEQSLAALSPEKAAKVRAALARKDAKGEADQSAVVAAADEQPAELLADEQLEELLNQMDEAKAAKVRAAIAAKGGE